MFNNNGRLLETVHVPEVTHNDRRRVAMIVKNYNEDPEVAQELLEIMGLDWVDNA